MWSLRARNWINRKYGFYTQQQIVSAHSVETTFSLILFVCSSFLNISFSIQKKKVLLGVYCYIFLDDNKKIRSKGILIYEDLLSC